MTSNICSVAKFNSESSFGDYRFVDSCLHIYKNQFFVLMISIYFCIRNITVALTVCHCC